MPIGLLAMMRRRLRKVRVRFVANKTGSPSVPADMAILNVQRQPGANVVAVAERIRAELPALQATLPPTVDVSILVDRTNVIRAALVNVEKALLISIALVVVNFIFLRDAPATLIPSLSIPLSIVGAFCAMYICLAKASTRSRGWR
jgi:multidrug efflux pump subunit AcrB